MIDGGSLRIAVVIPWYVGVARGDAERGLWYVMAELAKRGARIDVLTTGLPSERATSEAGVNVVRFPADPRDAAAFERAKSRLARQAMDEATERSFLDNGINSAKLIAFAEAAYDRYDAFFFFTFPHGLSVRGVRAVAGKAVLQPCLRDEPAARLPAAEAAIHAARELVFTSDAEFDLARRLYGPGVAEKSTVVGLRHDARPFAITRRRVAGFEPARESYLLYLGKRDRAEQVDLLAEAFTAFRRADPLRSTKLCLAGPGSVSLANRKRGLLDFGDVSEPAKQALLENAVAVLAPSCGESAPDALMSAWARSKPVGVNSRCRVTADLVLCAGAGWTAGSKAEWSRLFGTIDALSSEALGQLGRRGYDAYLDRVSPSRIFERYLEIFERTAESAVHKRVVLTGFAPTSDPWDDAARRAHVARRRLTQRGIGIAASDDYSPGPVVDLTELPEYTPADASTWDVTPSPTVSRQLADGKLNLLYVGRLDEDACLEQLIAGLAFLLALGQDTRLILAGRFGDDGELSERLFAQIGASGLSDRVLLFENVPVPVVAACYRSAHLFWSMAEDWPSVTPVLDAMLFSLPVIAYASEMARAVLGGGGLLFNAKQPLLEAAGLVHVVARDRGLREAIVIAQNERLRDYSIAHWLPALDAALP